MLADGTVLPFDEVFKDYEPDTGLLVRPFPYSPNGIEFWQIQNQDLVLLVQDYNVNRNAFIEYPELAVLYIREGAIGLGYDVDHVSLNGERVDAVELPSRDVGGLMRYIHKRKKEFSPEFQSTVRWLDRVGLDNLKPRRRAQPQLCVV